MAQNRQAKSKSFWLRLAKAERNHAQENKNKCLAKADDYGAAVYTVRIKALEHYIKSFEQE